MSVDDSFQGLRKRELKLDELERRFERLAGFGGGSGDGGSGTMDQIDKRVSRIETNFDSLRTELNTVGTSVATLLERTKHMPSRFEFYTVVIGTASLFAALVKLGVL